MGIRTAQNAQLGCPSFTDVSSAATPPVALGTIIEGYDDVNNRTNEYIYLQSPAAVVAGNELTYTTAYVGTVVGAGTGQVTAINTSGAGQFTWFQLKRRGVIA